MRPLWVRLGFVGVLACTIAATAVLVAAEPHAQEVPWLAEVQRPPVKIADDAPKLPPLLRDADGGPILTRAEWERRRDEIRRAWLDYLGPLAEKSIATPALRVLHEETLADGKVVRRLVAYDVEPDEPTEAYLLMPSKPQGRAPGVVVFHPTVDPSIRQPAGVTGRTEQAFGLSLAERGVVAFCPRNFLWPETGKIVADQQTQRFAQRHPQSKGMAKMLYDGRVALDILAAIPEVDFERLGTVGHSLGAKEVLYLAAFDPRIKAAVFSEGGIGLRFSNWNAPWYLGPQALDASFGHEHHELLALIAPRACLLVGGDSADGAQSWPFVAAALPVYSLYGQPARLGLLNHAKGHTVPKEAEQRILEWLETYLR